MKQGEIWLANLDPIEGSEQAGFRPVVIISGNVLNDNTKVVWCCPITTKIKRYHNNLILLPTEINGLKEESEVLTLHFRSLSKSRLKQKVGKISHNEILLVHSSVNDIFKY